MFRTLEELANEGELMYKWETELVREQLYSIIKDAAYAARVGRQLVEVVNLKAGANIKVDKETVDAITVARAEPGSRLLIDNEAYEQQTITPVKYGGVVQITGEIKEDANWDIMRRNIKRWGTKIGLKEDTIIFDSFSNATYGFSTQSGHAYTSAGTEIDVPDIVGMIAHIRAHDYFPNVMVLNPAQIAELNQIDTFVEADKVGNRATFEKGFCGKIYGLDVVETTSVAASTGYMLDTREAGMFVIRRPLTVKPFEIPERDSYGAAVTFRAAAQVIRPKAGCVLTVS